MSNEWKLTVDSAPGKCDRVSFTLHGKVHDIEGSFTATPDSTLKVIPKTVVQVDMEAAERKVLDMYMTPAPPSPKFKVGDRVRTYRGQTGKVIDVRARLSYGYMYRVYIDDSNLPGLYFVESKLSAVPKTATVELTIDELDFLDKLEAGRYTDFKFNLAKKLKDAASRLK